MTKGAGPGESSVMRRSQAGIMQRSAHVLARSWPELALAALAIPFITYGLGSYSLINGDEEIYHVVARHMVESGDWIRLQFYDEHRVYDTFMNAPLQYWARAIVISLFGSSEWTMRILSALFAVGSLLITCRLTLHLTSDRRAAFLAGLIQMTTLQFIYLHGARTGELEPVVVLLYTSIALLFLKGLESKGPFLAHHVCLALLLNVKSPVILVPLAAEAACFALFPAARPAFRRYILTGLAVLPFGLLWHAARMTILWEPFLEVVNRMAGEASAHKGVVGLQARWINAYYYCVTILFGAYPYSLAYPLAVVGGLMVDRKRADRLGFRVVAVFALAVFVFYVFVSKHHRWYIMPMYPLLSAFLAYSLLRLWSKRPGWLALAGIALSASFILFTRVNVASYNPFAFKAWSIPMKIRWSNFAGIPHEVGIIAVAVALFAAFLAAKRLLLRWSLQDLLGPALATVVAIWLVGSASYRVAMPLRFVDHRSRMAELRIQLDEEREAASAAGESIEYPITLRVGFDWDTRFYLSDQYEIVRDGQLIALYPRDPGDDAESPNRAR